MDKIRTHGYLLLLKIAPQCIMSGKKQWLQFVCVYIILLNLSLGMEAAPISTPNCTYSQDLKHVNCSFRNILDTTLNTTLLSISNKGIVTTLDLSYNSIQTLHSELFLNFKNLTKLFMHGNIITTIEQSAFKGLDSVQELYMNHNMLTTLTPGVFSAIPKLATLDISNNQLNALTANNFQGLINLQKLNLQSCAISTLEPGAFSGLSKLKELHLNNNSLSQIQNGTFQEVSMLTNLVLSSNELSALDGNILKPLRNLVLLDISENRLKTITNETVKYLREMTNLVSFNVSNNPIDCDCKIKEFLIWIENLPFASVNNMPFCDSPKGLSNINLLNVSLTEVANCDTANVIPPVNSQPTTTKDPNISSMDPLPYNPWVGWYTAIVLGSILVLFILCLILDKLKRVFYKRLKRKLKRIERQEQMQRNAANADDKSGLNTPTMLSSVSLNTENDDVTNGAEIAMEATEPLKTGNLRKTSISSNTSNNMKLAQDNAQRNIKETADAYQPMLGSEVKEKPLIPPMELVPGLTILEINPECPLHGSIKGNGVIPKGASNILNTAPVHGSMGAVPKRMPNIDNNTNTSPGKYISTTKL